MNKVTVSILNTGVANIASVRAALQKAGAQVENISKADEILKAQALILPGVGAFKEGMKSLRDNQNENVLLERLDLGKPTFAICLGLQLLCDASEESPGIKGLGFIKSSIKKFPESLRVPHFGWNRVHKESEESGSYAYFANSYRLTEAPKGWEVFWSEYGEPFVAMLRRGSVVAAQFHPELSGVFGRKILSSWIKEISC